MNQYLKQLPISAHLRIDEISDRFDTALASGTTVEIEDFLAQATEKIRSGLLVELICHEVDALRSRGEFPQIERYIARFSDCELEVRHAFELLNQRETKVLSAGDSSSVQAPSGRGRGRVPPDAGRFSNLRFKAAGGIGEVFEAVDSELDRIVAVKRLQDKFADRSEYQSRLSQEAKVTSELEHPNIVPIYGFGKDGNSRPYYAMKLMRGETLWEQIKEFHSSGQPTARESGERRIQFNKLLGHFVATCNAIDYAHSRGIIHRDLKPANIMIGKYGETVVADWGFARSIRTEDASDVSNEETFASSATVAPETMVGQLIGTPGYMSPEQAAGAHERLSAQTDIYGLGTTLYSMLAARAPYPAPPSAKNKKEFMRYLAQIVQGQHDPLREANPGCPPELIAVCEKALKVDPAQRYHTAADMARDIEAYTSGEPVSAWREPIRFRLRRQLRRHAQVIAGALTVAVAALVVIVLMSSFIVSQNEEIQSQNSLLSKTLDSARAARKQSIQTLARIRSDDALAGDSQDKLKVRVELLETISEIYGSLLQERSGRDEIEQQLAEDPDHELWMDYTSSRVRHAIDQELLGAHQQSISTLRECFAEVNLRLRASPDNVALERLRADITFHVAKSLDRYDHESARQQFAYSRRLWENLFEKTNALDDRLGLARTVDASGANSQSHGDNEAYRSAVETCARLLADVPADVDLSANQIARVADIWQMNAIYHQHERNFVAAEESYQRAEDLLRRGKSKYHVNAAIQDLLARVLQNRGVMLVSSLHRPSDAFPLYAEARDIREELAGPVDRDYYRSLGTLLYAEALAHDKTGLLQAVPLLRRARDIFRNLHTSLPNPDLAYWLASSNRALADILQSMPRSESETLALYRETVQLNQSYESRFQNRSDLATDYSSLAEFELEMGNLDESAAMFQAAIKEKQGLAAEDPNRRLSLANTLSSAAELHMARNEPDLAINRAAEAIQKLAELPLQSVFSDGVGIELIRSKYHRILARALIRKNDVVEARKKSQIARDIVQKLKEAYPRLEHLNMHSALASFSLALVCFHERDWQSAIELCEDGLETCPASPERWETTLLSLQLQTLWVRSRINQPDAGRRINYLLSRFDNNRKQFYQLRSDFPRSRLLGILERDLDTIATRLFAMAGGSQE